MVRVSSGELQRKIGHVQDMALVEPVTITNNGRDRLVMMSFEEYCRLKKRDRQVMTLDDFSEADLYAISNAEPPAQAASFDHEVNG